MAVGLGSGTAGVVLGETDHLAGPFSQQRPVCGAQHGKARSTAISAERRLMPKNLSRRFSGNISSYGPCSWS
ncbi:hypothetical protein [Streptomyces canus]|uniref:hypothetical protein n=1 Tax=Streptomyces canus TaxID=58343 RepID=UPI003F4B9D5F